MPKTTRRPYSNADTDPYAADIARGVNFRLMTHAEVRSGLTFELRPGLMDTDATDESLFVSEDAFGIVERIIGEAWPPYQNYGHWGQIEIPATTWKEILSRMGTLRKSFIVARCAAQIRPLIYAQWLVEHELRKQRSWERFRRRSIKFIAALSLRLQHLAQNFSHITIHGI